MPSPKGETRDLYFDSFFSSALRVSHSFLAQVNVVAVGVLEALDLVPEGVDLRLAELLDVVQARGAVNALAVLVNRGGQAAGRAVDVGAFLPGLYRVKQRDAVLGFDDLVCHRDKVGHRLAVLVVDTPDLFQAGDRHLLGGFGQLHLRGVAAVVLPDGGQLVDAAENRIARGRNEPVRLRRNCPRRRPAGSCPG